MLERLKHLKDLKYPDDLKYLRDLKYPNDLKYVQDVKEGHLSLPRFSDAPFAMATSYDTIACSSYGGAWNLCRRATLRWGGTHASLSRASTRLFVWYFAAAVCCLRWLAGWRFSLIRREGKSANCLLNLDKLGWSACLGVDAVLVIHCQQSMVLAG